MPSILPLLQHPRDDVVMHASSLAPIFSKKSCGSPVSMLRSGLLQCVCVCVSLAGWEEVTCCMFLILRGGGTIRGLVVCRPYALHLPKLTRDHLGEISISCSSVHNGLHSYPSNGTAKRARISPVGILHCIHLNNRRVSG